MGSTSDVISLSKEILKLIDKKGGRVTVASLKEIDGVGLARACQVVAALELSKRLERDLDGVIHDAAGVSAILHDIKNARQEHFVSLTLDGSRKLIQKRTIFVGTLNKSLIHPREIFADAISDRAASLVVAHNHPSGNPSPSAEDIAITGRLKACGELLGIAVDDHVIVSKNGFFSFRENGLV